jgi:hypothetical protein
MGRAKNLAFSRPVGRSLAETPETQATPGDRLEIGMICPKCGFSQEIGRECARCGLVFARWRGRETPPPASTPTRPAHDAPGALRRLFRIARWAVPALALLTLFLVLKNSPPPEIEVTPDAAKQAEQKIRAFRSAALYGTGAPLILAEAELNGWLGENLALSGPRGFSPSNSTSEPIIGMVNDAAAALTEGSRVRSSVRDVKIELLEDSLRVYAVVDLYGKSQSLELEGRLRNEDGHLALEPTQGKLGSLPLSSVVLRTAADRIFNSPANRDQLQLPPYIKDISVEGGRLVILPN